MEGALEHEYVKCRKCGSHNYISQTAAEEENNAYFDEIFRIIDNCSEDEAKRRIFGRYQAEDRRLKEKEYKAFEEAHEQILRLIASGGGLLEIGFGSGVKLCSYLESGVDAYGVDISTTAVQNFRRRYPKYGARVSTEIHFEKKFQFVYSCALFEHLDNPHSLLADISSLLAPDGLFVIDALPIVNRRKADIAPLYDINFWKPCHRILYSSKGLRMLMSQSGYSLEKSGVIDDFNYRVLSLHLQDGYGKVAYLRNPCLQDETLPDLDTFSSICRRALSVHSLASFGTFMFKKC